MMFSLILRLILMSFAIVLVGWVVPGIEIKDYFSAFFAAIAIGLINTFIRPIVMFFAFPINILTLGLFIFVINALMLSFAAYLVPGFSISNFFSALIGSFLLSILSLIINWAAGETQAA